MTPKPIQPRKAHKMNRVSYRNGTVNVSFDVDDEGATTNLGIRSANGKAPNAADIAAVPIDELAAFARLVGGNVTVTAGEYRRPGRKTAAEAVGADEGYDLAGQPSNYVAPVADTGNPLAR